MFGRLLPLLLVSLLVGCGGASSRQSGGYEVRAGTTMRIARPPIDRGQFVRHINRACRNAWGVIEENWDSFVEREASTTTPRQRFAAAVRTPLLSGIDFFFFDSIVMLGAPPGDSHKIESFIGPFQAAVELGQMGRWVAHSPTEIVPHFAVYNRGAGRYGLTDCLIDEAHLNGFTAS